jgi:hypothetical protein
MKKHLLIYVGVFLLLLIPLGMWWFSEERVVKRRSEHVMDILTISGDTKGMFRQAKVFSINGVLAPRFEIESSSIKRANGSYAKDQIESAFSWILSNAKESEFEITDFLEVNIEGDNAIVRAKVEGFLELSTSRPADGVFDVTLYWEKSDSNWVLEKVIWN